MIPLLDFGDKTGTLMATFEQRASGFWQAKVRRKGHAAQSRTFEKKVDAEAWARDVENRMDRGIFEDRREAETTTLRTALERYEREVTSKKKAQRQEKNFIKHWLERREFADRSLAGLRSSDFAAFRDERLKAVSSQTVRHELKLIAHLYSVAAKEWGIAVDNPVRNIKMPAQSKSRERRLSQEEERYLLAAAENSGAVDSDGKSRANPWIAPIIRFALATAMRQGEIMSLTWKHIDKDRRTATLEDTKNGERRVVPLSPAALAVLDALPRTLRGPVFATTQEALVQSWKRAVKRAQRLYAADCAAAGKEVDPDFLADLHFHDLRHEATSRLFELGALDTMTIAKITGHKTLQMLKRYTHLDASDIAEKLAKLNA
jgi:integrase